MVTIPIRRQFDSTTMDYFCRYKIEGLKQSRKKYPCLIIQAKKTSPKSGKKSVLLLHISIYLYLQNTRFTAYIKYIKWDQAALNVFYL